MYREIFKDLNYPQLLNTFDLLKINEILPWNFIKGNYEFWKNDFEKYGFNNYAPFARMINDDVIATFNTENTNNEIYLFILPLFPTSKPFKKLDNINAWLKLALEDSFEY